MISTSKRIQMLIPLWLFVLMLAEGGLGNTPLVERGDLNAQDTAAFNQEQALTELRKQIAGSENKPAAEVFKNIQIFKDMPAGRLLRVMEIGYAKSLGVTCTHCHVPGQWEKEEKPTKQIAREMGGMVSTINRELLRKIKNLKSESPTVTCTTCHRGQTKPAISLP